MPKRHRSLSVAVGKPQSQESETKTESEKKISKRAVIDLTLEDTDDDDVDSSDVFPMGLESEYSAAKLAGIAKREAAARSVAHRVKCLLADPRTPEQCDALRERIKKEFEDSCYDIEGKRTMTDHFYASLTRALKVYDDTVFDGQLCIQDDAVIRTILESDLTERSTLMYFDKAYICGGGFFAVNSPKLLMRQFADIKETFNHMVSAEVRKNTRTSTDMLTSFVGFILMSLEHEITHSLLAKLHWVDKVSHDAVPVHGLEFYLTLSAWTAQRGAVVGLMCGTPEYTMKYLHANLTGVGLKYNEEHEAELNFLCNDYVLADMKCLVNGKPRLPPLGFKQPKWALSRQSRLAPPPSLSPRSLKERETRILLLHSKKSRIRQ